MLISSLPPVIACQTVSSGFKSSCSDQRMRSAQSRQLQMYRHPAFSFPVIILKSLVLPAPFGPIIPTMPAGGRRKFRFSYRSLSPYALATPLASITLLPKRGPGGMYNSSFSSFSFLPVPTAFHTQLSGLYLCMPPFRTMHAPIQFALKCFLSFSIQFSPGSNAFVLIEPMNNCLPRNTFPAIVQESIRPRYRGERSCVTAITVPLYCFEMLFEPIHRFGIEVVGGFIKQ